MEGVLIAKKTCTTEQRKVWRELQPNNYVEIQDEIMYLMYSYSAKLHGNMYYVWISIIYLFVLIWS